jgi:hypothetical protein
MMKVKIGTGRFNGDIVQEYWAIGFGFITLMFGMILLIGSEAKWKSWVTLLVIVAIGAVCLWPISAETTDIKYELVDVAPYEGFTLQAKQVIVYKDTHNETQYLTMWKEDIHYKITDKDIGKVLINNIHQSNLLGMLEDTPTVTVYVQKG